MNVSVIICAHNPKEAFLQQTLSALRGQTLPTSEWDLCVIDNASINPLKDQLNLSWHPRARVVREDQLGLTNARIRAFNECSTELLIWSDDDNLLSADYIEVAVRFMGNHPNVGIAGGKSIPDYQLEPPDWYTPGMTPLGCRDLGDELQIAKSESKPGSYPQCAPIGAGMVSRREALKDWIELVQQDSRRRELGRTGTALTSGEDNDINLTAFRNGWDLAYVPELQLTHLIPPGRLTLDYQKRIAQVSFRDFIRVLDLHGIQPWSPISSTGSSLRKLKAWCLMQPWRSPQRAIKWHGACGQYEGRADIDDHSQNSAKSG